MSARIPIDRDRLSAFCRRWQVAELSLFGSVLRDDFRPDSDVDVLVAFNPDARRSLDDLLQMEEELRALFKREVDLVEKRLVQNPFRRHEILTTRETVFAR